MKKKTPKKPKVTNTTIANMLEGVASHLMETNAALRALAPSMGQPPGEKPDVTIIWPAKEQSLKRIADALEYRNRQTERDITRAYSKMDVGIKPKWSIWRGWW